MKISLSMGIALFCVLVAFGSPKTETLRVHFKSDSYVISDSDKEKIADFVKSISLKGDCEFQIHGHTDHEGNAAYNLNLSRQRAQAVKEFLADQEIDSLLMFTEAFGKKQLLVNRRDQESMRKNRRVDIVFKRFHFENTDELHAELAKSAENTFIIDSKMSGTLICQRGTRIHVPADGFIDESGELYEGEIELNIIEALDYHDFLANNLFTISEGKLLESGGMLHMSARGENGEKLLLDSAKTIDVAIPSNSPIQQDMQLFVSNTGGNWNETGQNFTNQSTLNIPERPVYEYPDTEWPGFFFDENSKPRYPSKPAYPTEPTPPRAESYERTIKWYQFLSRDQIEKSAELSYERALKDYDKRMDKYYHKVELYYRHLANHPVWVKEYEVKLARWTEEKEGSYLDFKENDYAEALRNYQMLTEKQRQKYAAEFAVWDSIRNAELDRYAVLIDQLGFPPGANPNYYVLQGSGLGWINVDRFKKLPWADRRNIIATLPEKIDNGRIMAILPQTKSMVQMEQLDDLTYRSLTLPKREEVLILAYKIEDGKIQVAQSRTRNVEEVDLEYRQMKLSEFRNFLRDLDA